MEYDLERFVQAQDGVYADVVRELRTGRKTGHWMWFVFPQLAGLGRSETARRYAIASLAEARTFLEHPLLGPRLRECTSLVVNTRAASLEALFGSLDALKFCSSMTLFARAAADGEPFGAALAAHCGGQPDRMTLDLLGDIDRPGRA
jgi:uncharacterized protein (DUF1810 family)